MATGGKFEAKSLVGLTLDQFEVKSEIARGGMGVVYKGYQPSLDRWVAIKTLPMDLAGDRELVSRFQREAKAMAALNNNNIVQCIHSGEAAGQYYIAMEYVEGPSVKDLLKSPTIETDKIFDILVQTCDGLEYAHKKGLVHRDIKPANLLYEEKTGCVKIADFGIAHFSKKDEDMLTLTADNVGMGTMNYMAPEQKLNAKGVDHRADIYALGVIIYEAFTGKLPLGKFKLPSEVNPKLPRVLDDIVQKCLSSEPADRYDSCIEVKAVLLEAKAATNDKSIRRSMRDALDRTLTAISPNKTVSVAVLGCVFLLFAGAILGLVGFAVQRASRGKLRDTLVADVTKARSAAEKATSGVTVGDGVKVKLVEAETAVKAADAASQKRDLEEQIAELKKALEAYNASVAALERDKSDKAAEKAAAEKSRLADLAKKVDERRAAVKALEDDGFKAAAEKALEAAKKSSESGDADACAKALGAVDEQVSYSKTSADNVKALKDSLAKLDEKKRGDGEKAVAEVVAMCKKGDFDATKTCVEAARKKLADLGQETTIAEVKKPPVVENPPVKTDDPKLTQAINEASDNAATARKEANEILGYAHKVDPKAAQSEATAAEDDYKNAPAKPVAERAAAYDAVAKKFQAARDVALKAIDAALAAAKAEAAPAEELAKDDWRDAVRAAEDVSTAVDLGDRAKGGATAVLKFRKAAKNADEVAKARANAEREVADAARRAAVVRVGDKHPSLGAGDDLAKQAAAAKPFEALALYKKAATAFGEADLAPPKKVAFAVAADHMTTFPDGQDAIAGCPQGFVAARGKTVQLYSSDCQLRGSLDLPDKVIAVATGDGDEVFVAYGLATKTTVARIVATNPLRMGDALPGVLGQPIGESVWALAYHRTTKRLFAAAGTKRIAVFSTETGAREPEIPNGIVDISAPMSLAVLRSGLLAVTGVRNPKDPEAQLTFEVRRFRFDEEKRAWNASGAPIVNGAAAVTAVGDSLLGVTHGSTDAQIQRLPSGGSLNSDVVALPIECTSKADVVRPKAALKLSAFGRYLYMLDLSPGDDKPVFGISPGRKRVKVYELKED